MDKGAKDKLARAPGENGRRHDAQKDLQPTTGRDETEMKTQKKMERASRRRSSSAGSEKMERDSDRQKQMEGHCSTDQGSQRAVVPMEEEEDLLRCAWWTSTDVSEKFVSSVVKVSETSIDTCKTA